jgi:hypothetical protein
MVTPIENKAETEVTIFLLLRDGAEQSLWALFVDNAYRFQNRDIVLPVSSFKKITSLYKLNN